MPRPRLPWAACLLPQAGVCGAGGAVHSIRELVAPAAEVSMAPSQAGPCAAMPPACSWPNLARPGLSGRCRASGWADTSGFSPSRPECRGPLRQQGAQPHPHMSLFANPPLGSGKSALPRPQEECGDDTRQNPQGLPARASDTVGQGSGSGSCSSPVPRAGNLSPLSLRGEAVEPWGAVCHGRPREELCPLLTDPGRWLAPDAVAQLVAWCLGPRQAPSGTQPGFPTGPSCRPRGLRPGSCLPTGAT